jgi:hypothetical protein
MLLGLQAVVVDDLGREVAWGLVKVLKQQCLLYVIGPGICCVVQEAKTWSGHHSPFLFFREVATLLWLMLGHYGTDNVVSDGQCEVPMSVLLSAHPLHEVLAVHSRPACL